MWRHLLLCLPLQKSGFHGFGTKIFLEHLLYHFGVKGATRETVKIDGPCIFAKMRHNTGGFN